MGKIHSSPLSGGHRDASFLKGETGTLVVLGDTFDELNEEAIAALTRPKWFSYRKGFPKLLNTTRTTDAGWGCVHRCGQMMIMETLQRHLPKVPAATLMELFRDENDSPFSLHKIARDGEKFGRKIGDWFYPSTVAKCLRNIVDEEVAMPESLLSGAPLCVMVLQPPVLHTELLHEHFKKYQGVLVLVPQRLGLNKIQSVYHSSLKQSLECKWSVGIIGGRPKHSLFFIGYRGDQLVFLDPHVVQPAYTATSEAGRTTDPHKSSFPIAEVDPTCLFCYFIPSVDEVDAFTAWMTDFVEVWGSRVLCPFCPLLSFFFNTEFKTPDSFPCRRAPFAGCW